MDTPVAKAVRNLLDNQRIAALGTLHEAEPYVSMVPFAVLRTAAAFVIHVSTLAAHTKDMLASPKVSLLVIAPPSTGVAPQATARLTIQGDARRFPSSMPDYAEARGAYLSRFPDSEMMFGLADFSLFVIRPRSLRFVGGFAQAKTLTPEGLAALLTTGTGTS